MTTRLTSKIGHRTPEYIYDADTDWKDWRFRLNELIKYRYLLQNLIARDLKVRYKNSVLGILWSLLNPLGLMIVFTVLFTVLSDGSVRQFPVFVLVGLMPWNFFNGALMSGTVSVTGNAPLVKKVYFPREMLPLSALFSNLVNFLFAAVVVVVFLYAFELDLTWHALWVPVILIVHLIFTMGLCFLLSALTVLYQDILMILDVILTAWFFLTPIFYPFEFYGETATLLGITFNPARVMRWFNPMASIVDGYRTVLWGTQASTGPVSMEPIFMLRTFLTAVIVLVIGYAVFARLEHLFGERL